MFEHEARVLLILSQDVLDRARVVAGKTTTALKLPVSLQIVLRALLEVGLKRENHSALLASVEGQAKALRHRRGLAGRAAEGTVETPGRGSRVPRGGRVEVADGVLQRATRDPGALRG